jgi:hypothetical protein
VLPTCVPVAAHAASENDMVAQRNTVEVRSRWTGRRAHAVARVAVARDRAAPVRALGAGRMCDAGRETEIFF